MGRKARGADETRARQNAFISEYILNGFKIEPACKALKIGRSTVHRWKCEDPDFVARLEAQQKQRQESLTHTDDRTKRLIDKALATLEQTIDDPFVATKVLEAHLPEIYDARIRAKLWERRAMDANNDTAPQNVTLLRGSEPLRLVKKEETKTGTD